MDNFWKDALKVTGSVAVVAYLFSVLIDKLFAQEILDFFGSGKTFYITMTILSALSIALILAILVNRKSSDSLPKDNDCEQTNQTRTVKISKSKLNGDIVFGDKTINNKDGESDQ